MNYNKEYDKIISILNKNNINTSNIKLELAGVAKHSQPLKFLKKTTLTKILKTIGNKNLSSVVQIFTDGSCLENDSKHPGTFALVVVHNNKVVYEYSGHDFVTTNNAMELSALIIASQIAHYLSKHEIRSLLHSDSQYSVNTLFGTWKGTSNKDLQRMFNDMCINRNMIECEWIKAHDGNILNEYADKLCAIEYNQIHGYYVTKRK